MIKFNQPYISHRAPDLILDALAGEQQQGSGGIGKLAEGEIQKLTKSKKSFLTPSCTSALEMATLLLDLQPGDEVLIPSFNFTSGATALVNYGVTPVFVDIDPSNLCIDTKSLDSYLSNKTKAISWVNYAGMTPNIDNIKKIATERNLLLIEDNAHSLGIEGEFGFAGSFGDISTQSYHATKNIQCGEGGSISINKPELIERAENLREKGTNRTKFFAGDVQKYEWIDKGSSYLLNEISAAYLYANLLDFEKIQKKLELYVESKKEIFPRFYFLSFEDLIEILSNSENKEKISLHLKTLFDGIVALEFKDDVIVKMYSKEKEEVELSKVVKTRTAVESWLLALADEMKSTVLKRLKEGQKSYSDDTRKDWVLQQPG